jgi:DNA polymerase I-like protein with 3'-5' exonuclease and polymerase domains
MVCYSVQVGDGKPECSYFTDIEFSKNLREAIGKAKLLVGFNLKYDIHWARRLGVELPKGVRVWDCQSAEFLLRGQQGPYPSLNEALTRFDLGQKDDKVAEYWELGVETTDIPVEELKHYNMRDVELTYKLYLKQQEVMSDKLKRLCTIMGLDLLVLEDMEWNGVKLDVDLCRKKEDETRTKLVAQTAELRELLGASDAINLDSGHQLSCLLYGGSFELTTVDRVEPQVYKSGQKKGQEYEKTYWKTEVVECPGLFTAREGDKTKLVSKLADGREFPIYATGEDVLKQLKKPTKKHRRIVDLLLERAESSKLLDTYFGALPNLLEKMEWGEYLHGNLNQCVARTGRLSSSNPNMQNFSSAVDEILVSRYAS